MKDYDDFPPINAFKRVLRSIPSSADLFVSLWKLKKKNNPRVAVDRRTIKNIFMISPTLFRNHLLALSRIDLLTFEETMDYFLVDFDESKN